MSDPIYGMQFTSNKDAIGESTYLSTQQRLQSDVTNTVPLFNITTIPAGTGIPIDWSTVVTNSEQLFLVTHSLGYIPQVLILFHLIPISLSNNPSTFSGAYTMGGIVLAEGGNFTDWIDYTVTAETLTINHHNQSYGAGTGSYTSLAPAYNLWFKYVICNNTQIQTVTLH